MKQYEAVIQAMKDNGGYATLGQLSLAAVRIPGSEWKTKTPAASIRRIVQVYPDIFFKIRPGLWGLKSEKARILKLLDLAGSPSPAKIEQLNHSYYQGLLLQIGNLKRYQTFVPHQDKNRSFLEGKLSDVSTLAQFPNFTYESLINRGRTVDVTWFNDRGFPRAFFEVEHSTDIRNSLLKFVQFQDFRIQFRIVADKVRQREFETKRDEIIPLPIKSEVQFINYEQLAKWHSNEVEKSELGEEINL